MVSPLRRFKRFKVVQEVQGDSRRFEEVREAGGANTALVEPLIC
jgi:hypothetical protein